MREPAVSIVTATYNRSNVLRFAIESVLAQMFADWELLVMGDACTDDTAEVVASYGDARIRFVNAERNFGEQSGPNNAGVALSRGRYVAFLNHDDLWLPDHLAIGVAELERGRADLVYALQIAFAPNGEGRLLSFGEYSLYSSVPASTWIFRRELAERVGPWRAGHALHMAPSQEWLHRAWKSGARLRPIPRVTVLALGSSERRGTYAERQSHEHVAIVERLRNEPRFLEDELTKIAVRMTANAGSAAIAAPLARATKNAVLRAGAVFGIHPIALRNALATRRRGGALDRARRMRGLPPLPRPEES